MTAAEWRQEVVWRMTGECMIPEHTLQTPNPHRDAPINGNEGGVPNLMAHCMFYADIIRSFLGEGARVLDVGSGCGIGSRSYFIHTGQPVVAIDRGDAHWVADRFYPCPGVYRVVASIEDDLSDIVLSHAPYDVVAMTEVYEHISEDASERACANIDRVTADDAVVAITVPVWPVGDDPNPHHLRTFRSKEEAIVEIQDRLSGNKRVVWARTGEHGLPWGDGSRDNQ